MIITLINYIVQLLCCSPIMSPNSDSGLIAIKQLGTSQDGESWVKASCGKRVCGYFMDKCDNIEAYIAYHILD